MRSIRREARFRGDDVAARASLRDRRVHGDSAARIIQAHQPRRLQCQLMHRVHPGSWIESGMCCAAGDDELGCSGGLAPCFELPVWSGCRFQHQHRRAAPGFLFDHPTRAFAPGLFVRSPKKDNTPARQPARMCQRIDRE